VKAVIFGASAGVGRALAAELAKSGATLLLIASDERDLAAVRSDLLLVGDGRSRIFIRAMDLTQVAPAQVAEVIREDIGTADAVFFVAGLGAVDDIGTLPSPMAERLLRINFLTPVLLSNEIIRGALLAPNGVLLFVSSVAAARARGRNVIYGAAKRGLEQYAEALRMADLGAPIKVVVCRLGYVATAMMDPQSPWLPKAAPKLVARRIVASARSGGGLHYIPHWWRWVMFVFRILPDAIVRRLGV
jgi:decaprenylphospho-beta-D-erythro-pentofuranosid-2-ulose 2-reductase